jgi:glycosyltransferase involved in cell wall biosynthesis
MTPPSISAVVPSAFRPALLERCLRGLSASEGDLESVVVVHSGDDATLAALDRWRSRLPLHEEVGDRPGAAARRNQGWRRCDSHVIAFTDDDCEPRPGWAAALAMTFEEAVDVVTGPVTPHPDDANVGGTFARTLRVTSPGDLYPGANVAVRRAALDRVSGFDESMTGGEDTDLAWRVIETAADPSAASAWAPDALVWHAVREMRFISHLRSLPRWSSLPLVVRRHPALRRNLTAGLFWKPEHVTAVAGLAGLALWPVDRRGAMLALPHLWRRIRPHGGYAGMELVVSDLAEIAVLAAGSMRHGSLLL